MYLVALPEPGRYVTLSYRWGSSPKQFITTRQDITELEVKNSLQRRFPDFPSTIQDAIDCVRELGEGFLWVDALCIYLS